MIPGVVLAGAPGNRKEGIEMRLLGTAPVIRRVRLTVACLTAGTVSAGGLILAPANAPPNGHNPARGIPLDLNDRANVPHFNPRPCGAISPTLSTVAAA